MSIVAYIGHTGQRLVLDPRDASTVDALRACIAAETAVQPRNQILLTPQGKQVRPQTLLAEHELFVFDSRLFSGAPPSDAVQEIAHGDDFDPGSPPDTLTNQNDLGAWQELFAARRQYAAALLEGCTDRAALAQQIRDEQVVIERSLAVAVASLQHHIKSAEKQFATTEAWSNEILQEQQPHIETWEQNLASLRLVPARHDFARFIQPTAAASSSRRLSQQSNMASLYAFVDVASVQRAADAASSNASGLARKVARLRDNLRSAASKSAGLQQTVDQINGRAVEESVAEPEQLVTEIGLVVNKMASDLEHVRSLPRTTQSVSQASKMALLHTRQYLRSLTDYCSEINELVQKRREEKQRAARMAMEHMQTLSGIESQLARLYQDMKSINLSEEQQAAFASLGVVSRLPSVYGQLLVESVRRREWVAKMKHDSTNLQEEVATYQEEEEKRRRKWTRIVEDVVNAEALVSGVLGIELSLQNEGGSWPEVTREELQEYLRTLTEVFGSGPATEEIDQAIRDLDKPTRKQIKYAKAFKNGSMHEAAFGNTSLMMRGDEQNRALRESNLLLEQELISHKSRVVKLESLLYRANQATRASTGDVFSPVTDGSLSARSPSAQFSEDFSRQNSISKPRRTSAIQGIEEKKLVKRVLDLEAELQTYKDSELARKTNDAEAQRQVEEAVSTKRDLMQNMEAQQREFATERRGLEKELAEAKERIEEIENEIERLVGSRDGIDYEIARLKQDAADHAARAATEHDARTALERKLEQTEQARAHAESQVQQMREARKQQREAETECLQLLTSAWAHLSPDAEAPAGLERLAAAFEDLTRRSASHAKDLQDAVAFARSENESLKSNNERQKAELITAAAQQSEAETKARQTEEKLAADEARVKTLESQLSAEQEQLRVERSRFADGETGSEVLRQRVAEEEARASKLSIEVAEAKSHINSLDTEILRLQKAEKTLQESAAMHAEWAEKKRERAKEISQRLFSHNVRLSRLLERLGLAISYQDNAMVIERASKLGASTGNVLDASAQQLSRVTSMTSPAPTRKSSTTDPEPAAEFRGLHWMNAVTTEDEAAQFEAFITHISRFDLDIFSDAVTKRVKDFEYTAKKYSKESKESTKRAEAYKERALKLRHEAHAKIAVRDFKEGDLALFLPTRGGQVKGAWAAFNIGCPHYFLAERDGMRLGTRDFIVARIQKVEQKVVDLSRAPAGATPVVDLEGDGPSSMVVEDDNPFDLSDGLTWWMVHAVEERGAGAAPTTPGLGKSTVAISGLDAKGSIRVKRGSKNDDASKHLNKSLESRRSSTGSKKSAVVPPSPKVAAAGGSSNINVNVPSSRLQSASQSSSLMKPGSLLEAGFSPSGLGVTTTEPAGQFYPPTQPSGLHQVRNSLPPGGEFLSSPPSLDGQSRRSEAPWSSKFSPSGMLSFLASSPPPAQQHLQTYRPLQLPPQQQEPSRHESRTPPRAEANVPPALPPKIPNQPVPTQQTQTQGGSASMTAQAKPGWESLWSAEFSVESSPDKGRK